MSRLVAAGPDVSCAVAACRHGSERGATRLNPEMQFAPRDLTIRRIGRAAISDQPSKASCAKDEVSALVFLVVELGAFRHRDECISDDGCAELLNLFGDRHGATAQARSQFIVMSAYRKSLHEVPIHAPRVTPTNLRVTGHYERPHDTMQNKEAPRGASSFFQNSVRLSMCFSSMSALRY